MKNIIAGIVLYNPDINRLIENVNSIAPQVSLLLLVDNCSSNLKQIKQYFEKNNKIRIIENKENYGIAKALNQIMEFADKEGADWALTLDQDSVCPNNLIQTALKFTSIKNIGIICPTITDNRINSELTKHSESNEYEFVTRCISSGALTNVRAWEKVKYFNDEMFIDYVDFDFCARLLLNGYKILRMNNVTLNHHLGDSTLKRMLFGKVRVSNHSTFRKYYIARNIIFYIRLYRKKLNVKAEYLRIIKVILFTILYESNKREKLTAILRGIHDGKNMKLQ